MNRINIFSLLAALFAFTIFTACDNAPEEITNLEKKVFSSKEVPYQAVDLGLSVKWSNKNYGAGAPENVGYYMTFGCLDPNDFSAKKPDTGGNNIAGTKLDVATMQLGSGWVIPNRDQLKELCVKCSWKSVNQNNVWGFQVTGPNGNSIFIPLSGSMGTYSSSIVYDTNCVYLMSSEWISNWSISPYYLKVYENDKFQVLFNPGSSDFPYNNYRMPIRPIYTK